MSLIEERDFGTPAARATESVALVMSRPALRPSA